MTSFSEPSEADVTRETTMAASEISVEESREGEEPAAVEQDGKLSLRMKLVTPVEEGSSGSEHFSLQSKSYFFFFVDFDTLTFSLTVLHQEPMII